VFYIFTLEHLGTIKTTKSTTEHLRATKVSQFTAKKITDESLLLSKEALLQQSTAYCDLQQSHKDTRVSQKYTRTKNHTFESQTQTLTLPLFSCKGATVPVQHLRPQLQPAQQPEDSLADSHRHQAVRVLAMPVSDSDATAAATVTCLFACLCSSFHRPPPPWQR